MDEINGFIFYRSFYESAKHLNENDRLKVYDALMEFALNGKEIDLDGAAMALFLAFKPQIEANNKRRENGKKGAEYGELGGRPPKNNPNETPVKPQSDTEETPNKPQDNPNETPNDKDKDKENNKDNSKDKDNIPPYNPPVEKNGKEKKKTPKKVKTGMTQEEKDELNNIFIEKTKEFSDKLKNKVKEWLEYKITERRDTYQPIGLSNLLTEIDNNSKIHGETAVIAVISHSMANSWVGICWEKIEKLKGSANNGSNSGHNNAFNPKNAGGDTGEYIPKVEVIEL